MIVVSSRFSSIVWTDKQTNTQTDADERCFTPATLVGVSNYILKVQTKICKRQLSTQPPNMPPDDMMIMIMVAVVMTTMHYLGHEEALGEQHDFTDLLHIGYNDDHRPEQCLDGLREFRTTGVARIHCDEDSNTRIHRDHLTFELLFTHYTPLTGVQECAPGPGPLRGSSSPILGL